jgi:hypothetical protein
LLDVKSAGAMPAFFMATPPRKPHLGTQTNNYKMLSVTIRNDLPAAHDFLTIEMF